MKFTARHLIIITLTVATIGAMSLRLKTMETSGAGSAGQAASYTITCNDGVDVVIPAHLAKDSPVLSAMFEGGFEEGITKKGAAKNFRSNAMQRLVNYLQAVHERRIKENAKKSFDEKFLGLKPSTKDLLDLRRNEENMLVNYPLSDFGIGNIFDYYGIEIEPEPLARVLITKLSSKEALDSFKANGTVDGITTNGFELTPTKALDLIKTHFDTFRTITSTHAFGETRTKTVDLVGKENVVAKIMFLQLPVRYAEMMRNPPHIRDIYMTFDQEARALV